MRPQFEPEPGAAEMVRDQIAARGVTDPAVLAAMRAVPRSRFVPVKLRTSAHDDRALPIEQRQTISQPFMVAHMTALLRLRPESRVLEIGTGSGYQTAVLALLSREVVTLERHPELTAQARKRLDALGFRNIAYHTADGTLGWPDAAPYDAILVTAAAPEVPPALLAQLAPGGRLVCPTGTRHTQELVIVSRRGGGWVYENDTPCVFVPLIGAEGWPDDSGN